MTKRPAQPDEKLALTPWQCEYFLGRLRATKLDLAEARRNLADVCLMSDALLTRILAGRPVAKRSLCQLIDRYEEFSA